MAKFKTLTKAHQKLLTKLKADLASAHVTIFMYGPDNRTVWSECYKLATPDHQDNFNDAAKALNDFEYDMVQEGRGYYDTFRHFHHY